MVVIRREYLERVQTKWFIIGCLLGPVLITGVDPRAGVAVAAEPSRRRANEPHCESDATGAGLGERLRTLLGPTTPTTPDRRLG